MGKQNLDKKKNVFLDPGVVNGYPAGIYSFNMHCAPLVAGAKAGVIITQAP